MLNGASIITRKKPVEPKEPEIKIEPILPKIDPILPKVEHILPKIEPIERPRGTFFEHSPERLILQTLEDGPRMRDKLVRLSSVYMTREEAERLLDRMLKSGIISSTRNGRISIVETR